MNNNQAGSPSDPGRSKIQSFLEALRASQGRSNSEMGAKPKDSNFSEFQAKKETEKRRLESFHQARQQEWNKVYSAKERQTQERLEQIRVQISELAKQLKRLDTNLAKAALAPVTSIGQYQESYFEHLQKMIQLFRMNVNSANSWLDLYSSRSKKRGNYWSMAKSRGTSFTQSNERNVATSVG